MKTRMLISPKIAIICGALVVSIIAILGARMSDAAFAADLSSKANDALASVGAGAVKTRFITRGRWPTRHPVLSGGEALDEGTRNNAAKAVGSVAGVGGISWEDGKVLAVSGFAPTSPTHCQDEVQTLLAARSIRFEESRSDIAPTSDALLDEVAATLKPCLGSIIAVTGHTDATGPEEDNLALSLERARAVEAALRKRGIPAQGMRARGLGSSRPIEGFAPEDPGNRRIEFAVIATTPLRPTPVDTPGPR